LQELKSLEAIIDQVPESYLKAVFSAHIASRYVYKYGLGGNEFTFFDFMSNLLANPKK